MQARRLLTLISEDSVDSDAAHKYRHSAFYTLRVLELYLQKAESIRHIGTSPAVSVVITITEYLHKNVWQAQLDVPAIQT
jgi:hypothetical protein